MPAATLIALTQMTMNGARCQALFSSGLQPSDAPTADMVATAISRAVQQFGAGGCAGRMAQEFGDHPDAARATCWAPRCSCARCRGWVCPGRGRLSPRGRGGALVGAAGSPGRDPL
jgi:hypothetical protein